MQYSPLPSDKKYYYVFQHNIYSHQTKVIVYTVHEEYKIKDTSSAVEYSNVESVHKLHYVVVQCQFSSSLMDPECPHKQEVFQSGLSSASYDSVHYIESLEHQVAVQQ